MINTPDGTQVSEIILPDGSSATRVFDPNGNRVFGEAAIPDSVVNRLLLDEGSGTTVIDLAGSDDGTLSNGGVWTDNTIFRGGTAPFFDQTDDYGEWQPRSTTPITITCRVLNADSFSDSFPYPWGFGDGPAIRYAVAGNNWSLRVGADNQGGTVSDTPQGTERILTARIDNTEAAIDVYDGDLNKIGSGGTSNPSTSFQSSTMYFADRNPADRPFGDNIDLIDVHNEFVTDIDSLVSEVYG